MKLVLDTGILMLILKGDIRVRTIVEEIAKGAKAYTTTLNLIEIYCKTREKLGAQTAIMWFNKLAHSKDLTITPVDTNLALEAGKLKAKYKKLISITDSVIAALAQREKAIVVTTDKKLENIKEIQVQVYEI